MADSLRYCEEEGGSHGPDHTERVYHLALTIGGRLGSRLDILAAAALSTISAGVMKQKAGAGFAMP